MLTLCLITLSAENYRLNCAYKLASKCEDYWCKLWVAAQVKLDATNAELRIYKTMVGVVLKDTDE